MKQNLYVLRDIKANVYNPPVTADNDEVMKRMMKSAIKRKCNLTEYPEDYQIHCIGTYDDKTAEINTEEMRFVCNLNELMPKEYTTNLFEGASFDQSR